MRKRVSDGYEWIRHVKEECIDVENHSTSIYTLGISVYSTKKKITYFRFVRRLSLTMAEDLAQVIDSYVNDNKVMIFSKSRCPFCHKVKELFKTLEIDYFALELDRLPNGQEMQSALAKKVGRSSVPQVFINTKHIGGCDNTMAAHSSGELMKYLQ